MTQQAREVGEFGLWVDHFEQNVSVQAQVDASIDFDGACAIAEPVRRPSSSRSGGSSSAKAAMDNNFCARLPTQAIPNTFGPQSFSSPRNGSTRRCFFACSTTSAACRYVGTDRMPCS
jgi:hypothetical protein